MSSNPPAGKNYRQAAVSERTIWQSWTALPAKTRLRVSLAMTGFALAGIYISDKLEQTIPAEDHTHTPIEKST